MSKLTKSWFWQIWHLISWILDFVNLVYTGFVYNPVYKLIGLCQNCQNWRFWVKLSILIIFVNFDKIGNFLTICCSGNVYFESTISLGWCLEGMSKLRSTFVIFGYLVLREIDQFEVLWISRCTFRSWAMRESGCRLTVDSKWTLLVLEVFQDLIKIDQFWSIFLQIR